LFTPHPDPLPQGARENKLKLKKADLIKHGLEIWLDKEGEKGKFYNFRTRKYGVLIFGQRRLPLPRGEGAFFG
jgi:hypothetical protein